MGLFKVKAIKNSRNGQINLSVSKKSNPKLWKKLDKKLNKLFNVRLDIDG